jgi:hypothetical protein
MLTALSRFMARFLPPQGEFHHRASILIFRIWR